MSKIVSAKEALIALAEGKSVRELPQGPWKRLGSNGTTIDYENGQWLEVLEMRLTRQFEVKEDPPVKAGQKIRFRSSWHTYVVRHVDTAWIFATSEDQARPYADRVDSFRAGVKSNQLEVLP